MIRTMGVAHFTIPVTDAERILAFYTEILGMTAVQVNHAGPFCCRGRRRTTVSEWQFLKLVAPSQGRNRHIDNEIRPRMDSRSAYNAPRRTEPDKRRALINHERDMVFLDSGGDCIILARSAQAADPKEHDLHHDFIVAADEYEDAKAFLTESGVEIFFEEDRQGGAVNGPSAYFHDPDGNILEIINLTSYKGTQPPGLGKG